MYIQKLHNIIENDVDNFQHNLLLKSIKENQLPFVNILDDDLQQIFAFATKIKNTAERLIVFGMGGSILGAKGIVACINNSQKITFVDYINPDKFDNLLSNIKLNKTAFLFISKSGNTFETISQYNALSNYFDKDAAELNNRLFFITENMDSILGQYSKDHATMLHKKDIGGRFSCFSNVGLVPAFFAGVDIVGFIEGAKAAVNEAMHQDGKLSDAIRAATSNIQVGINIFVIMSYIYDFSRVSDWYIQLLSESTGKQGNGITPLQSNGTADQHSILQLYLSGPKDKYFTFVHTDNQSRGVSIGNEMSKNDICLGDMLDVQCKATIDSIIDCKLPVKEIIFNELNEHSLGMFMMNTMLEVVAICNHLKVNAFDQPDVEQIKIRSRNLLNVF